MTASLPTKCLAVQQPFAWAICAGLKDIENRTWSTKHRGPLLILASMAKTRVNALAKAFSDGRPLDTSLFTYGKIVGVVDVVDVVELANSDESSPWAQGPFCWKLANARVFGTPVSCTGRLNLFEPDPDVLERAHAQCRRARPATVGKAERAWVEALHSSQIGAFWQQEDGAGLIRVCSHLLQSTPADGDLLFTRAVGYVIDEKPSLALRDANAALKVGGNRARALLARSYAYDALGDRKRAKADLAEAVRLDPSIKDDT